MSGKFNLDDYKDVAERLEEFFAKHPEGSLQAEMTYMSEPAGWLCIASAYRNPEDPRPGIGHAFEPVPGKTPYTRDSECQNAETAAWGRALVALGDKTKKIASRQEIRNRQPEPKAASEGQKKRLHAVIASIAKQRGVDPEQVRSALKGAVGIDSFTALTADQAARANTLLLEWRQKVGAAA